MKNEIIYETVEQYIDALNFEHISSIAFSQTDEKRIVEINKNEYKVCDKISVELIAYKNAVIHKCIVADVKLQKLFDFLIDKGFAVKRFNRNIV